MIFIYVVPNFATPTVGEQSCLYGLWQVQVELRKKWQYYRSLGLGGLFGSRRLASSATTMYAAVPPTEGLRQSAGQQTTQKHLSAPPGASVNRIYLQTPNNTPDGDVIDDTVTSWVPNDGCHGYDDVTQQHGPDAVCMTRLNFDRH